MLEGRDVFCGIAVDGDQVGKFSGLQRADLLGPTKQVRGYYSSRKRDRSGR